MNQDSYKPEADCFNECEWLRILFLLSDLQTWLSELEKDLFMKQPSAKKRKLFQKKYYITASSFAHIIERHYYKIPRHIGAAKFTISVPEILDWLRLAFQAKPSRPPGSCRHIRELDTGKEIGFDRAGCSTSILTVVTDSGGKIITAFPGSTRCQSNQSRSETNGDAADDCLTIAEESQAVYLRRAG